MMTRDRLLYVLRSVYRLTPSEMQQVETFVKALDHDLNSAQLEGVVLYLAALRGDCGARADIA